MTIRAYFMAKMYDAAMKKIENACLSAWRQDLLSGISGEVLEIGCGTGINLSFYPESVSKLTLTEPEPHMLNRLKRKIKPAMAGKCVATQAAADALDFPNDTFDAVVSTLVLCSVGSPDSALREIKRVLKPGGQFYFIEHVVAKDTPRLLKWQKIFQPCWVRLCGNCHLTRDTEASIRQAGFTFHTLEHLTSSGSPPIVSPTIKGIAIHAKT